MRKNKDKQVESIFGRRARKFRRIRISGFVCQLADGRSVFKGEIDELSAQGFSLSKVSELFCDESKVYRAIFSERDNYYKISVIPRWSKPDSDGDGFKVGYKILDSDWKWVHFSMDTLSLSLQE
ncbi:MAG: hypothetical protein ACI8ZB_000920 [Desulforhopalus sp.]|jgi:hypothetical protein